MLKVKVLKIKVGLCPEEKCLWHITEPKSTEKVFPKI